MNVHLAAHPQLLKVAQLPMFPFEKKTSGWGHNAAPARAAPTQWPPHCPLPTLPTLYCNKGTSPHIFKVIRSLLVKHQPILMTPKEEEGHLENGGKDPLGKAQQTLPYARKAKNCFLPAGCFSLCSKEKLPRIS